ncbi:MAG: alpha/beta hydrolase [Candidatus Rokubacteria bacterium]|nr:alpha/beta hydrolase [Candidatus Rokubacteria bacterium]
MDVACRLTVPDGAVIGYRRWRPGPPRRLLALLHGLASNLTRWSEFVARTGLGATWDIIRPDLRGYGTSLRRGRISMDVWCADLAAILDREARAGVVLAGHCLGANLAAEFALRHPGRAAGLVLIEPMFAEALAGPLRRAAALRPVLGPAVFVIRALNALGLHRRRLRPLDLAALDRETRAAMAASADDTLRRRYASPWADLAVTPAAVYAQSLIAVSRGLPDLSGLRVPVLALLSTGGALSDPAITARRLAELPDCRIVHLDARHWIPTERPEEMRAAIEAWCRTIAGP